ncbi:MAG: transporter substrate-binding domain-containing protein [Neomegalonema sp.]|nr:transporter substrate-binding domain-containing protein [Neomegalonema sp.]
MPLPRMTKETLVPMIFAFIAAVLGVMNIAALGPAPTLDPPIGASIVLSGRYNMSEMGDFVGVVEGSVHQKDLRRLLKGPKDRARMMGFKTEAQAMAALRRGMVDSVYTAPTTAARWTQAVPGMRIYHSAQLVPLLRGWGVPL